jgi:hypothetical protein
MGWNGADLLSDFSAELGDTSTAFQTKVLRWINDGIREISTSHNWHFLREKGKVILASGQDTHSIILTTPSAPTLAALAGGSLEDGGSYKVLVTFYESVAKVESRAGTASAAIVPTGANLSITANSVPVSASTLVTSRRIYVSKDGAAYFYYGEIANNTATTATITAETSSTVQAPDFDAIHMIDGDFWLEDDRILEGYTVQRLRFETNGAVSDGTPSIWAPVNEHEIVVYPKPTSNTTASFYYFKLPAQVFNSSDSQPQIPAWLFDTLYSYVIWRGYAYRDRDGKESKKINYIESLGDMISRKGKPVKKSGRVRGVTPDSDGFPA